MARAKVNYRELKKFAKKISKLSDKQIQQFNEKTIKELAARLLAKVKRRTPKSKPEYETTKTGKQRTVKHGGTLQRGWNIGEVIKKGNEYTIEVINPVEYASYVEYGHRGKYVPALGKTLHLNTHYTPGQFMLTISEEELKQDISRIIQNKLDEFLGEVFND